MQTVPLSPEPQGTKLAEVLAAERRRAEGQFLEALEITERAREIADLSNQRLFAAIRRLNHVDRKLRANGGQP